MIGLKPAGDFPGPAYPQPENTLNTEPRQISKRIPSVIEQLERRLLLSSFSVADADPPELTIQGTAGNDTISVGLSTGGVLEAIVNGTTRTYTPAQYAGGVVIDTGQSSGPGDTLNIGGLPDVPTQVQSEGPLTANVGSVNRGVQDISASPLIIGTGTGQASIRLTVNDSSDAGARTATLDTMAVTGITYGVLTGLALGTIEFDAARVASPVVINAGDGGNHFLVNQTPAGPVINLNTGNGADNVDVKATGAGSVLNINGQNGADIVDVSSDSDEDIRGVVNVSNPMGKTKLTVGTGVPGASCRNVTLDTFSAAGRQSYGSIQGLTPAPINFDGADMQTVDIHGNGCDFLTIKNTPGGARIDAITFASNDVLGLAAGQSLIVLTGGTESPDSATIDFSTGKIGKGSNIEIEAGEIDIVGSSATDSFALRGGSIVHDDVDVHYDDQPLVELHLTHGTFTVTDDLMGITGYNTIAIGADTRVLVKATQSILIYPIRGAAVIFSPGANMVTHGILPPIDGKLDLGTSEWDITVLQSDPAIQLRNLLRQGLGGKSGITSSAADATHNLGFVDSFPGSVQIKYALYGDANLDGKVDFGDLLALAQNYGKTDAYWFQGDFNYDGKVDFSDLLKLTQNYGKTLAAVPQAVASR